jgi:hypothetical protein
MMPELRIWMEYASVSLMISGLLGKLFGGDDDDGLVLECHDVVLDALSDADRTKRHARRHGQELAGPVECGRGAGAA